MAVFLFLPFLILLTTLIKGKAKYVITFLLLFFLLICTKNGPDYVAYEDMYSIVASTGTYPHGEAGFLQLLLVNNNLSISYDLFRVLYLSFFFILVLIVIGKHSDNFSLSVVIALLAYITYLVSTLRQFAVMAIFLFSIMNSIKIIKEDENVKKRSSRIKLIICLLLLFLGLLFHIYSTIFSIIVFIISIVSRKLSSIKFIVVTLVIFSYIIRFFMVFLIPLIPFLNQSSIYVSSSFVTVGLLSRLITFICLLILYDSKDKENRILFIAYSLSIAAYFMLPMELSAGRLTNTTKFVEVILFANLFMKIKKRTIINGTNIASFTYLATNIAMYIYQIINQTGYETFISIF